MAEPSAWQVLAVFAGLAVVFALVPLGLTRLWARAWAPPKPGPEKNATYECGVVSAGPALVQFRSPYYLFGLLFLLFDVEALLLIPFAVAFKELPADAAVAMLVFVLLLVEGLVWAWVKGLLKWR